MFFSFAIYFTLYLLFVESLLSALAVLRNIYARVKPFAKRFIDIVNRFTRFTDGRSKKWLSAIDNVLTAITTAHLVSGGVSSAVSIFADLGASMCTRNVTNQVLGFDLYEQVDDITAVFFDFASQTNDLLSDLVGALDRSPFAEIRETLSSIVDNFIPVITTLEPLTLFGSMLETPIPIPWINLPRPVVYEGPSRCLRSSQVGYSSYKGTVTPNTCWEHTPSGWYIPPMSSQR